MVTPERSPSFSDAANARHAAALAKNPDNLDLEMAYVDAIFAAANLERIISNLNKQTP